VLTTRGLVLTAGAVGAAVAGLAYGVEEFVFVGISVGVLLVLGVGSVWFGARRSRTGLRVVVTVPVAEVTAHQAATVALTIAGGGGRRSSVRVEDPDDHWSVSYPGLAESSVAASRRAPSPAAPGTPGTASGTAPGGVTRGFPAFGQRSSRGWLGGPEPRSRQERTRFRRRVAGARPVLALGPGGDATMSIAVPTARRGLLTLSDVGLWCVDPFGLVARRITVAPPAHVIVYPEPADAAAGRSDATRRGAPVRAAEVGLTSALSGDELSGLRPYEPGDRLTRLHWPSLARSGELVVREFVEPRAGSVSLLVDLRPSVHSGDSIEKTIARASGVGLAALGRGLTVELCTSTGDRVVIAPGGSGRQSMLRALALLGPASAPPAVVRRWGDRPTGGAVWATGGVPGADVVLVTTPSGAAQRSLPAALGPLADTVLVP
jgi:hypothetical protein